MFLKVRSLVSFLIKLCFVLPFFQGALTHASDFSKAQAAQLKKGSTEKPVSKNFQDWCEVTKKTLRAGQNLFNRQQYSLSLAEFMLARRLPCLEYHEHAQWGYLMALTLLDETQEANNFVLHEWLPETSNFQKRKKLYEAYYLGLHNNSDELLRVEKFKQWKSELPKAKNPAFAATASALVPGSGQIYTGSYQSGVFAFILNALFLSTTLELKNQNLNSAALASGFIFSVVYVGNILNAYESAEKVNHNFQQQSVESYKNNEFEEFRLNFTF